MGAPTTQSLDDDSSHGDMQGHLAGGEEPELVWEVERYWLENLKVGELVLQEILGRSSGKPYADLLGPLKIVKLEGKSADLVS